MGALQVRSAMFYTKTANITASGTSMACPVVSGISALYLQANPAAVPAEARPHPITMLQSQFLPLLSSLHCSAVNTSSTLALKLIF